MNEKREKGQRENMAHSHIENNKSEAAEQVNSYCITRESERKDVVQE